LLKDIKALSDAEKKAEKDKRINRAKACHSSPGSKSNHTPKNLILHCLAAFERL
jgi:hypothetical protein